MLNCDFTNGGDAALLMNWAWHHEMSEFTWCLRFRLQNMSVSKSLLQDSAAALQQKRRDLGHLNSNVKSSKSSGACGFPDEALASRQKKSGSFEQRSSGGAGRCKTTGDDVK